MRVHTIKVVTDDNDDLSTERLEVALEQLLQIRQGGFVADAKVGFGFLQRLISENLRLKRQEFVRADTKDLGASPWKPEGLPSGLELLSQAPSDDELYIPDDWDAVQDFSDLEVTNLDQLVGQTSSVLDEADEEEEDLFFRAKVIDPTPTRKRRPVLANSRPQSVWSSAVNPRRLLIICILAALVMAMGVFLTGCNGAKPDKKTSFVMIGTMGNGAVRIWAPAKWSQARKQQAGAIAGTHYVWTIQTQGFYLWTFNSSLISNGTKAYISGQYITGWNYYIHDVKYLSSKHAPRAGFGYVDRKDKEIHVAAGNNCAQPWGFRMFVQAFIDPDPYWQDQNIWAPIFTPGGLEQSLVTQIQIYWPTCPP